MPDDESDATLIAESIDNPQRFLVRFLIDTSCRCTHT